MKTKTLFSVSLILCKMGAAQNFIDKYLTDSLIYTTIGTSTNGLDQPRDLDFKPNTNELWIVNKATNNGGTNVIFYNAGQSNQTYQYKKDTHSSHFMPYPSAIAFGDDGRWACVNEIQNTNSASPTFMGPALWSGDTSIFAKVFQNNWVSDKPLGSHLDMLHQSPFSMGIAHDSASRYWVYDGHNGNICKYEFSSDHSPGYDDHSNGKIWRYTEVAVLRKNNIPSHITLDRDSGWLYIVDAGNKRVLRMNTKTGSVTANLTVPSTAAEPLAGYYKVTGVQWEVYLDSNEFVQPCGIDFYNNRLLVTDNSNGDILIYNTSDTVPVKLGTIETGTAGIMGIKIGTDGKIWYVNATENKVVRIDPLPTTTDASILSIVSPISVNQPNYFSPGYGVCANSSTINPVVVLQNVGSDTLKSVIINYQLNSGTNNTYNWTGILNPGDTAHVSLPSIAVTFGGQKFTAYTSEPNDTTDQNPLNDKKQASFRAYTSVSAIPFSEGFQGTTFPPSGWTYLSYNPNNKWARKTSAGGFGWSNACAKMNNFGGDLNISNQTDYLILPGFDFSTGNTNLSLQFNVAYAQYNGNTSDYLSVLVSTDCGNTWTSVYNKGGNSLSTTGFQTAVFTPNASQWKHEYISLSSYSGQADVKIMFKSTSGYGNNLYVDDIAIDNNANSTGIEESQNATIQIYPNPSNGIFNIDLTALQSKNSQLFVYNLMGEQVTAFTIPAANQYTLDLSDKAEGVYLIKIANDSQTITRKITISK